MAHNSYTRPGGNWTDGVDELTAAELEDFEAKMFKAVNGDDGGTWSPSSAIVITGSGIDPTLKANEWPNFGADAGAKRTLVRVGFASPTTRTFSVNVVASGIMQGQGVGLAFSRLIEGGWVPHGATITLIKCRVTITNAHASLPTTYPMMSVQRIDLATGGLVTFLKSTDAGAGVNETFVGAVSTPVGNYNANGNISFLYTPDQNNVVDRTLYSYVINVIDEAGGGAILGNLFIGFEITFTLPEMAIA